MMLQLPTTAGRFSKAQIAEINRGGKVKLRQPKPKADPLMRLIAKADLALDNALDARNRLSKIKQQLSETDRGWPKSHICDELLNVRWQIGFWFNSEKHIDQEFRRAKRAFNGQLKHYRERLRKHRPGHGMADYEIETKQGIESAKRKLALLDTYLEPMKLAHRRETRRLHQVQSKAGLLAARRQWARSMTKLRTITADVAAQKPVTKEGAIALIPYVRRRMCVSCGVDFSFDADMNGDLPVLLNRAHAYLAKQ